MQISYEYLNADIASFYRDEYPINFPCVPRTGDYIQGLQYGFILKVMAVTFLSEHRVTLTLGIDKIGHADPIFENCVI